MAVVSVTNGKGEWVRKKRKNGTYQDVCLCVNNIDFSKGCVSCTHAETGARSSTQYACTYCYANYKNYHPAEAKDFYPEKLEKELSERFKQNPKMKYLRLGKITDVGHKAYREQLLSTFEILKKLKGQGLIIQKHLEFDERVAKIAKETKSTICFSIGYDKFEAGARSYGHDNEFRFENAIKYKESGVNAVFKLLTDLTVSPEEADEFGGNACRAIELSKQYNIPISLLPFRIKSREIAREVTGVSWDVLQDQNEKDSMIVEHRNRAGSYVMEEKIPSNIDDFAEGEETSLSEKSYVTYLIPNRLDPGWSDYKNNICGKIGTIWTGYEYCDKCNMTDLEGKILRPIKFRQRLLPHVDTTDLRNSINESNKRKKERAKKEKYDGQQFLFPESNEELSIEK